MAWPVVGWIIENPNLRGTVKLVALILADFANEKGLAWPSIETLATKTGLSRRQIQRILPQIEKAGLVQISKGTGRKQSHRYQFICEANGDKMSSFPQRNGDNLSRKGDMVSPDPIRTKEKKNAVSLNGMTSKRGHKVAL
ncbi:MAG: helix-turn-helix domain-containing protein [Bdellovibrionales bacterium]|nr:helix-turn-helix domain-containing protein [Bdellovibrionales bacterium]